MKLNELASSNESDLRRALGSALFMFSDIDIKQYLGEYTTNNINDDLWCELIYKFGERKLRKFMSNPNVFITLLPSTLFSNLKYKWEKIVNISNVDYDALKPFNITLDETQLDSLKTLKDKTSYNDNDSTYGFNSVENTPTDDSKGSSEREYERNIDNKRDYTRVGNIGNTSFQDLVEQERNVANYLIRDILLKDIVNAMCRGVY